MHLKTLIAQLLILFSFHYSFGQDGTLDSTFDADGIVTTAVGSSYDYGQAIAIQTDGKIVVGGSANMGTYDQFMIARYETDGTLDVTFDGDGKVTTDVGPFNDWIRDMKIQSDGKIVAAGVSYSPANENFIELARYNTDGSLDTSFSSDGKVSTDFSPENEAIWGMELQSDGKIIVAGFTIVNLYSVVAVLRYNVDGSLDSTFDSDGIVTTAVGSNNDDIGYSVTVQNDGKIVVGGTTNSGLAGQFRDMLLIRYNSDGSMDTSFDGDGIATFPSPTDDIGYSVNMQPDGKIILAGFATTSGQQMFAVERFESNGSPDTTFDGDGQAVTPFGTLAGEARSSLVQSDGKILLVGHKGYVFINDTVALVRYEANGSLDTTYGNNGIVLTAVGTSEDFAFDAALQSDDKIVVTGYSLAGPQNFDVAVLRYNNSVTSGVNENENSNTEITVYPNPFSERTTMLLEKFIEKGTFELFNVFGQKINSTKFSGNEFHFDRHDVSGGVFFFSIFDDHSFFTSGKLIIQ